MKLTAKNIIRVLIIPITLLVAYLSLFAIWRIFDLPPEDELLRIITNFINQYGLIIIFFSAILEGLLLIGNYFPGGAVIFLGVIAAKGNIQHAVIVVLVVCIAFSISYTINYCLGKYGWYKLFVKFGLQSTLDSMQRKLSNRVFTAIISSYWFPNLAAVCSTAAGILRVPIKTFLIQSNLAIIIWNIFWGTLAYLTGTTLLKLKLVYVLTFILVWCFLILIKAVFFDMKREEI